MICARRCLPRAGVLNAGGRISAALRPDPRGPHRVPRRSLLIKVARQVEQRLRLRRGARYLNAALPGSPRTWELVNRTIAVRIDAQWLTKYNGNGEKR